MMKLFSKKQKEKDTRPFWKKSLHRLGKTGANVLSGLFNMTVVTGFVGVGLAQYGDDPLDGLHKVMTQNNIQHLEETATVVDPLYVYDELLVPIPTNYNQFTIYGNANYMHGEIRDYFFSKQHTDHLIASHIKHVFLEYPKDLQYIVDLLYDGSLDKQKFVESLNDNIKPLWWTLDQADHYHGLMADMILALKDSGAKLHFVDPGLGPSGMGDESKAILFEMAGVTIELLEKEGAVNPSMSSLDIFIAMQKFVYQKITQDPEFKNKLENLYKDFFEKRLGTDNEVIAENIRNIAGDGKSVIFYGAAHIMREYDLDEMLGESNVKTISLYSTKADYADALLSLVYNSALPELPTRIHVLDEQKVYITDKKHVPHVPPEWARPFVKPLG